jgi:hypothetical protein
MTRKRNDPALPERETVECQLAGDIDVYSTDRARVQYLARFGLSSSRAAIVAPIAFGPAA